MIITKFSWDFSWKYPFWDTLSAKKWFYQTMSVWFYVPVCIDGILYLLYLQYFETRTSRRLVEMLGPGIAIRFRNALLELQISCNQYPYVLFSSPLQPSTDLTSSTLQKYRVDNRIVEWGQKNTFIYSKWRSTRRRRANT